MGLVDEKDYIMRMIKQMVRVLFSLMFGKEYQSVEIELQEKCSVSGMKLNEFFKMIDNGNVNEAENILLDEIDYTNKNEVAFAVLFYQYIGDKGEDFLLENNYSQEEVLDGLKQVVRKSGYESVLNLM